MRTRVKICGITRLEDAQLVCDSGADAIGLVFYDKSPRHVSIEQAAEISRSLPPFVTRVALFKDADKAYIESVLQHVQIDLLQFHGMETASFCEQFEFPYIKAIGMKGVSNVVEALRQAELSYASSKGLLLDGHAPGEDGGSGESFDWSIVSEISLPVILAGGLSVDNVSQAITIARPFAVDVSSGVERSPGIKDAEKIRAFMQQVN